MARHRTSSKLDWLQKRPDLQTPEGQQLLETLAQHKSQIGDKVDPLLPWLTREWKRGRIEHGIYPRGGRLYRTTPNGSIPLNPDTLSHWADWYNSQHPTRQGVDIGSKQFQLPQMQERIQTWEQQMREEAEQAELKQQDDAEILHSWPDGWTVRNLKPEHLKYEGDVMGHCVNGYGYADRVRNGDTSIVSLRDHQNRPHATAELSLPDAYERVPQELWERYLGRSLGAVPAMAHRMFNQYLRSAETMLGRHAPGTIEKVVPEESQDEWHNNIVNGLARDYSQSPENMRAVLNLAMSPEWQQIKDDTGSLNNSKIVQIQGKSDSVPIPEYQNRLKQWFQTFPEETRPNWDEYRGPLRHIGEINADRHDEIDDEGYDQGGYGAHGDYGLVEPPRDTHYREVLQSLPYDRHAPSGWPTMVYREEDGNALYNHALNRGEIPQLGEALEDYQDNIAQPAYQDHEDQNYDYYPPYPGESLDEEPERWEQPEPDPMYPSQGDDRTPQERFNEAQEAYEEAEQQKLENVPEMGAVNHLYSLLNPHYGGNPPGYQNEIQPQVQQPNQPLSKTASPLHHHFHPWTGKRCSCPWGKRKLRRTAGDNLNKVLKAPDKVLHTPEGQRFLSSLTGMIERNPDADGLAPWLVQRWKKDDIRHHQGDDRIYQRTWPDHDGRSEGYWHDTEIPGYQWEPTESKLPEWSQWYEARQHPSRRGVNVMHPDFDIFAMNDKAEEHRKALEQEEQVKQDLSYGDVVKRWPDGWHVRHLTSPGTDTERALAGEGNAMGHCIGSHEQPYQECAAQGNIDAYSLRDKYGWPHATWHTNNNSHSIAETFGREDSSLKPEYNDRYEEWCRENGYDPYAVGHEEGEGEAAEVTLPAADDVRSYLDLHGDGDGYGEYIPDDVNYGENTEFNYQTPNFDSVAGDMYNNDRYRWNDDIGDDDRKSVFNTAIDQYNFPELNKAMMEHGIENDEHQRIQDQWQQWAKPYYHPLTGEFVQPNWQTDLLPIMEQLQKPLFEEPKKCRNCGQQGGHASWCGNKEEEISPEYGYPQYQEPAYDSNFPYHNPPTPLTYAKTAAPLYYRFCFSPTSGEVTIAHNGEQEQKLHGDLARERNEPGLVHGFAYRIGGGFRLTDYESKPLSDPYVAAQVMRTLRGEEGYRPAEDASQDWSEANDDFSRQHSGIPLPAA